MIAPTLKQRDAAHAERPWCGGASELIERVAGIIDVDQLLADDKELSEKVLKAAGEILASARYDVDAYRQWVANNPTFGKSEHPDGGKVRRKGMA